MTARLFILFPLWLLTILPAQGRPQRTVILDHMAFFLSWRPESTAGSVKVRVLGMNGIRVVPVGIAKAGSASAVDSGSFFVCGQDGDSGIVQFAEYDPQTESYSLPTGARYSEVGSDFVGVTCDGESNTVYALDTGKNRLVAFFPCSLGDPLPAPVTVLDASAFPPLAAADDLTLGRGETPTQIAVYTHGTSRVEDDRWILTAGAQGWTIDFHPGLSRASYLDPSELTVGATQAGVKGPPGVQVHVVKISGPEREVSVVGSVRADAQGSGIAALSAPLQAGEVYATRNNSYGSDILPPYASPIYRHGVVEPMHGSVAMQALDGGLALLSYIGSDRFEVPLFANVSDLSTTPSQYNVSLAVGSAGDVTQVSGRYFLAAPAAIDSTLNIFQDGLDGGLASVSLPIPANQDLAGAVVYYQWWVHIDAQSIALSNIVGVPIRGFRFVPFGLEEWFGEGGLTPASALKTPSVAEQRAAVRRWLLGGGARELTRGNLQELRARLRN